MYGSPSGVLRVQKSLSTRLIFLTKKNDEIFKALRIIIRNLTYRTWRRRIMRHKFQRQFTNLNPINIFSKSRQPLISILTNFSRLASSSLRHKKNPPKPIYLLLDSSLFGCDKNVKKTKKSLWRARFDNTDILDHM